MQRAFLFQQSGEAPMTCLPDTDEAARAQAKKAYLAAYRAANPEKYRLYAQKQNARVKERRRVAREAKALPAGMRRCCLCKDIKPGDTANFYPRPSRASGLASWCIVCARARQAQWLAKNADRVKAYRRARYEQHGETIRAQIAQYRAENPEKIQEARRRFWEKAKAENGPILLRRLMTSQINKSLRTLGKGGKCRRSWQRILGYTAADLKRHLERQFTPQMTWENRGTYWEVDHIRPVASFNITGPDCPDFLECWGILNLRPLPKRENRQKAARRTHLL